MDGFTVWFDFKRAFVGDTLSSGGLVGQRPEVGQAGPHLGRLFRVESLPNDLRERLGLRDDLLEIGTRDFLQLRITQGRSREGLHGCDRLPDIVAGFAEAPGSLVIRLIADDGITRHAHPMDNSKPMPSSAPRPRRGSDLATSCRLKSADCAPLTIRSNGHE